GVLSADPPQLSGFVVVRVQYGGDTTVSRKIMTHQLASWGVAVDAVSEPDRIVPLLQQAAASGRGFDAAILDQSIAGDDPLALALSIRAQPELAGVRLILATTPA